MRRLLVFTHPGVIEVNRTLFQTLARVADIEIGMVVPKRWKGDLITDLAFKKAPNDSDLRIFDMPVMFSGNGSLFFYSAMLKNVVEEFTPEHVFVDEEPWSFAAWQAYLACKGIPCSFSTKQNLKKRVPPPFHFIQNYIFGQAPLAFATSTEVTDVLRWKGFKKPVHVLPCAFDPKIFKPVSSNQKTETRERLGIPKNAFLVGYFGRLTEEKGIQDLTSAMGKSMRLPQFKDAHYLWVGNGPLYNEVQGAIHVLPRGRGTLLPAIPHHEVGQTLAALDVLVLPSRTKWWWKEQFGRILTEAMACEVAVIGSDSGEIPNVIQAAGGGLVFREGDSDELLAKINELLTNPSLLERFKKAGAPYVREHFSHEAVAKVLANGMGFALKGHEAQVASNI